MHAFQRGLRNGSAVAVIGLDRLDRHRVGHHILKHEPDGRDQRGEDVPDIGRQHAHHQLFIAGESHHNHQAGGHEHRADIDEERLPVPEEIDQVTERHFQRPGETGPEPQTREKRGGKPEFLLYKKTLDDPGKPGNTGRQIDHERRQVTPAHLPHDAQKIIYKPSPETAVVKSRHGRVSFLAL